MLVNKFDAAVGEVENLHHMLQNQTFINKLTN